MSMRFATLFLILLAPLAPADEERLTLERIFASPDLAGPTLRTPRLSPDGSRVTFLRAREEDRSMLDLWEYHLDDDETRLLVAADEVVADEGEL
ncbi:MAG: S9 family peptidase, partial [Wenzhouxiangella sp.]